ncbi:MAG TPA: DUF1697 domain-containing protein [Opitutaceae bacterium]|nr:DUF1697 domain-containing protein [Opitutaceae bacterium]
MQTSTPHHNHIVLLRGVNVGGNRPLPMAGLRAWLQTLPFDNPRTLLQSGNVVLGSARLAGAALEAMLEREARRSLGLETEFHARSREEWDRILAANPFPKEAKADPSHLLILVHKSAPSAAAAQALQAAITGRERAAVRGRETFIYFPDGVGTSRLTGAVIARALGVAGTARNWNTALKLAALAAA